MAGSLACCQGEAGMAYWREASSSNKTWQGNSEVVGGRRTLAAAADCVGTHGFD